MSTESNFFDEFIAVGNQFEGAVPVFHGKNSLNFKGVDSVIKVGRNVIFENVRIEMLTGSGTLIIGDNVRVNGLLQIAPLSKIEIGENTIFNRQSHLSAWEGASIKVGRGCLCSNVEIRTSDMHSIVDLISGERINPAKSTIIEDHVWLGEGVTVYKGVSIGSGSVVGGHSVVTSTVPSYTMVSGVPAKVIKKRVSWQRELMPAATLGPTQISAYLPTKEEMAQIIKDGNTKELIFDIDMYMKSTGTNFEDLEGYAQFYYARSQYLSRNFKAARQCLQVVIYKNPQHKVAIQLLEKIPAEV
ncbi:acyltransferase [Pseudomonas sp. NPDC089408]|uniref:acyltransferase n=1 Tax=Pseudomonas sp. NPDC089408 TaxID=3364465 RepID=UPI00380E7FF8